MTTKTILWIKADTNDADYITSENSVNEGDLEVIRKVCKVIKENSGLHSIKWETGEIGNPHETWGKLLTDFEIEIFDDYIPYGEYGIHTVEAVELRKIEVLEKFI